MPKFSRDLLTNNFGLVRDFLSEYWNQLRRQSRQNIFQGRIHLSGALSGRDTTGVQKTASGLIKLVSPNPEIPVSEKVLEWALRLALECRRRRQEQQKRIGSAEFRNAQFSYSMGEDGVEKFVATPELYSENSINGDPLPPGQWGENSQPAGTGTVQRRCSLRRAKCLYAVERTGRRTASRTSTSSQCNCGRLTALRGALR